MNNHYGITQHAGAWQTHTSIAFFSTQQCMQLTDYVWLTYTQLYTDNYKYCSECTKWQEQDHTDCHQATDSSTSWCWMDEGQEHESAMSDDFVVAKHITSHYTHVNMHLWDWKIYSFLKMYSGWHRNKCTHFNAVQVNEMYYSGLQPSWAHLRHLQKKQSKKKLTYNASFYMLITCIVWMVQRFVQEVAILHIIWLLCHWFQLQSTK